MVCQLTGNPAAAEAWYGKALAAYQDAGDRVGEAQTLGNLASLLRTQPARLVAARQLAADSLAIMQTLEPGAAAIWKIYDILADIAAAAGDAGQARAYRRQARQAKAAFAGTQYELRRHAQLIVAVVAAVQEPPLRAQLESVLEKRTGKLVAALRRLLDGERDEDALCDELDLQDAMIVLAILRGLDDPQSLAALVE